MNKNLELWNRVAETDPAFTKQANVKGNKIKSIIPQYQLMQATEEFGPYGQGWGFKDIKHDLSLVGDLGLVVFYATFYAKDIEFPITNTISVWRDGARTKVDDDWAKKAETDALTKALSKIGFSADVFMGYHDDMRYVNEVTQKIQGLKQAEANRPKEFTREQWIAGIRKLEGQLKELNGGAGLEREQEALEKASIDDLKVIGEQLKQAIAEGKK